MSAGPPLSMMISIVGTSGSGKTTLIEKLISILKGRGYRIGTVKHTHHDMEMDHPGKDSFRYRTAGAATVILASPERITLFRDLPAADPSRLGMYFQDIDLVIVEGFKNEKGPKIEVYRKENKKSLLYDGSGDFVALVTDADMALPIPVFGLNDAVAVADLIETRLLRGKSPAVSGKEREGL